MSKQQSKRTANKQQAKRAADKQQPTKQPPTKPAEKHQSKRSRRMAAYRLSTLTALILAILTGVEYVAAQMEMGATIMMGLGVLKAFFVVHFFMHMSRLWSPEGSH